MSILALLNSGSEVNAIHPTLARELGLFIRPTDVGAQKIDGTMLDTFEIVVTAFLMTDKANQVRFFKKTFLVANLSPKVVLGMSFLTLSGADVDFLSGKLWWRTYTTKEALQTTTYVKLVEKKEFAAAALNPEHETFVVYVVSLSSTPLNTRPQISDLIAKEASTKVAANYSDFADLFSPALTSELPKHNGINNHTIELVNSCQQPLFEPINSLGPVKLKIQKACIEINLANGFIRLSKSPSAAPILFNWKLVGLFCLGVNY